MIKGLIKLAYRQKIDVANKGNFEKSVLSISYEEFLMKSQAYNTEQKFRTFKEMVLNDEKANSLHYKTGFAINNLIQELNKKIPELQDTLGKSLDFEMHKFEIIESDITNPAAHKVAITYITGVLTFFGNVGEYMLLAEGDKLDQASSEPVDTFMVKIQDGLTVISYKQV
jgi:hypothetical protein